MLDVFLMCTSLNKTKTCQIPYSLLTTVNGFLDSAIMETSWHVVINESLFLTWHDVSLGFSSPTSAYCEILSVLLPLRISLVLHVVSYCVIFLNQSSCLLCCFILQLLMEQEGYLHLPFQSLCLITYCSLTV